MEGMPLDADEVYPGIWVGSVPYRKEAAQEWFTFIVLCSEDFQFPAGDFPRAKVLHCPLVDDDSILSGATLALIFASARAVAEARENGEQVLVTCAAGLNRSALIAGLAMSMLGEKFPVERLRAHRNPTCLSNAAFRRLVTGENCAASFYLPNRTSSRKGD
jgi:protein-tyrosine phosphatase